MRITGGNSSVVLACSYFHTCSSSSLAVIILKYFSCLAAGIAWTTWSATCLSLRMSSSRALMASSLLRGRHKTIGCHLIGFFFLPLHVCLALTQSACWEGGTRCKDPATPSHRSSPDKIAKIRHRGVSAGRVQYTSASQCSSSLSFLPRHLFRHSRFGDF